MTAGSRTKKTNNKRSSTEHGGLCPLSNIIYLLDNNNNLIFIMIGNIISII